MTKTKTDPRLHDDAVRLSARIRELRMEAEYTQKDLADRIGCGQSRVSQYERKAPLQMATLLKIADALEVELPLLLCVTDPQWREQFGWDNEGTEVRYANVG